MAIRESEIPMRSGLCFFLFILVACQDVNGPNCMGTDDCVLYRESVESPCWEWNTVPRYSRLGQVSTLIASYWLDSDGGCYYITSDGWDIPDGFTFAPEGHWCITGEGLPNGEIECQ